jgi:hypothetical protein
VGSFVDGVSGGGEGVQGHQVRPDAQAVER